MESFLMGHALVEDSLDEQIATLQESVAGEKTSTASSSQAEYDQQRLT